MIEQYAINYRIATSKDVDFLSQILVDAAVASGVEMTLADLDNDAEGRQYVEGFTTQSNDVGVVAEIQGGIRIGAAWVRKLLVGAFPMNKPLPELTIGVHPDYQRLGIGKRLLEALYVLLSERGIPKICLGVEEHNSNAIRLYEQQGWSTYDSLGPYLVMSKVVGDL